MTSLPFVTPEEGTPLQKRDEEFRTIYASFFSVITKAADFIIDRNRRHWKPLEGMDNRTMRATLTFNNFEDAQTGNAVEAILGAAAVDAGKAGSNSSLNEIEGTFTVQSAVLRKAREWAVALKKECEKSSGVRSRAG